MIPIIRGGPMCSKEWRTGLLLLLAVLCTSLGGCSSEHGTEDGSLVAARPGSDSLDTTETGTGTACAVAPAPAWTFTGRMVEHRGLHSAVTLPDGRVLA